MTNQELLLFLYRLLHAVKEDEEERQSIRDFIYVILENPPRDSAYPDDIRVLSYKFKQHGVWFPDPDDPGQTTP